MQYSLNITGRVISGRGMFLRCTVSSRWDTSSRPPFPAVTYASGVSKHSPGFTVFAHWPKSSSGREAIRFRQSSFRRISICQEEGQASCTAQVTPAFVSSTAMKGKYPRTGMDPS